MSEVQRENIKKIQNFLSGCFEFWIFEFGEKLLTWHQVNKSHTQGKFWGLLEMWCNSQGHMKAANPTMKLSVVYLLGHRVNVIKAVLERAHIHTHTHTHAHTHTRCFLESVSVYLTSISQVEWFACSDAGFRSIIQLMSRVKLNVENASKWHFSLS